MSLAPNNPDDLQRTKKGVEPCILVIFGATGDLTSRKLIPALYNLALEKQLPTHFACVGVARKEKSHDAFRKEMLDAVNLYSRNKPANEEVWNSFKDEIFYHQAEFDDDKGYEV